MLRFDLVCFVLVHLLLVIDAKLQLRAEKEFIPSRDLEELLNITLQDRDAQEVADQCFQNLGPCEPDSRYRNFDGSCNNIIFPMWGLTNSAAIRARPANYSDGLSIPRMAASGDPLPNSRNLRLKLIPDKNREDRSFWILFQGWAQFISHDTGHSTPKAEGLRCCSEDGKVLDAFSNLCMPILVPKNDSFYSAFGVECIDMFRAKTTKELGCTATDIDTQIVDVTHFIDCSQVYGSNKTIADSLRLFENGLMRFQVHKGEVFLPNVANPRASCDIREEDPVEVCYAAGDKRVNQNVVLTPVQILMLRVHNTIALELSKINPQWKDETVYQETRRIIIAIVQLITYKEFLPILVGESILKKMNMFVDPRQGLESGYDKFMNPSTVSEFMNTAYRSLHTLVAPKVNLQEVTSDESLSDKYTDDDFDQIHMDEILRPNMMGLIEKDNINEKEEITEQRCMDGGRERDVNKNRRKRNTDGTERLKRSEVERYFEDYGEGDEEYDIDIDELYKLLEDPNDDENYDEEPQNDDANFDDGEKVMVEKRAEHLEELKEVNFKKNERRLVPRKFKSVEIDLVKWMDRPQIVHRFYTPFMRGLQSQFGQSYDKFDAFSLNNLLFQSTKPFGRDLEAISIQRQMDFGTPCYNDFREYTRLPRAKDFSDLRDVMDDENIELLRSAYTSVNDIDLFTGGLYERPVPGALTGVTFWKLIVEQFFRWKFGDRYYFTFKGQAGSFSPAQLAEIMKVSSGWLFCAGVNNIGRVHPNNMNNKLHNNGEVPCSQLPQMDLTKWKIK